MGEKNSLDDLILHADRVLQRYIRWQVSEEDSVLAERFKAKVNLIDRAIKILIEAKS